jgi:glutathione peroxidase
MSSAYDYSFDKITGGPLPLSTFKDKVVLVVNTASKCGLTPQYDGLEKLYSDYKTRAWWCWASPATSSWARSRGPRGDRDFCSTTFGIDFPMTSKVDVKEAARHPFYAWAEEELGEPAVPVWNFHKILIGKNGEAIQAFGPAPTAGRRTRRRDRGGAVGYSAAFASPNRSPRLPFTARSTVSRRRSPSMRMLFPGIHIMAM